MTYLPAHLLRPATAPDVVGPAILFPKPRRSDDLALITGGSEPHFLFLSGSYLGHAFPKAEAKRFQGFAVEQVRFEVDHFSAFEPAYIDQPIGALIRTGIGLEIIGIKKAQHGFNESEHIEVVLGMGKDVHDFSIGFTRWKAVVGSGHDRFEVFEFKGADTATG